MTTFSNPKYIQQTQECDGFRKSVCSFVAGRTDASISAFSSGSASTKGTSSKAPQLKKMIRSPSDEVLLTELAIDAKDITIYDITSVITVGEKAELKPYGEWKCYMDNSTQEFFIEITDKTKLEALNQSALMNIFEVAQDAGAQLIYMCVRKTLDKKALSIYMRTFLFIGFGQLSGEEQKKISMTQTHTLLKYNVNGYESD